jgi:ankyrin repeat protein
MKGQEDDVAFVAATTANSVSSTHHEACSSSSSSESAVCVDIRDFLVAVAEGNVGVVSEMLQSSVESSKRECLLMKDDDGYPALSIASRHGHADIVQLLLELDDADVNANEETLPTTDPNLKDEALQSLLRTINTVTKMQKIDALRYTPLLLASKHGHARVVEILLQNGADVNKCTGTTALRTASGHLHEECVRLLLAHGADVSICQPQTGGTALYSASMVGHVGIATMLLAHGANVNDATRKTQNSCLMMATFFRRTLMVDLLLSHGAHPNWVNVEGVTALWYAARKGNVTKEIQECLLAHGAKATPGLLLTSALFSDSTTARRLWNYRTWSLPVTTAASVTPGVGKEVP